MDREITDAGKRAANLSGAPQAGGATTRQSLFGGGTLVARLLRLMARVGRDLESTAYRRLKELEARQAKGPTRPGAPNRVRQSGGFPDDAHVTP